MKQLSKDGEHFPNVSVSTLSTTNLLTPRRCDIITGKPVMREVLNNAELV
jgi:hypothetical protein